MGAHLAWITAGALALGAAPARAVTLPSAPGLYVGGTTALPMLSSHVDISIHGPIVEVTVVQRFENRGTNPTEATFIFPLPADAAVTAMAITTGGTTIHAAIATRAAAQQRYEAAVNAGVGAALLDQERPDVFTQTIAAIPAKGSVEVTLRYDTLASFRSGTWELVLPLVVAPRFVPGIATARPTTGTGSAPDTNRAPDASRVTPTTAPGGGGPTTIAVQFGEAVTELASPTHELVAKGTTATLTDPHSDHDVVVRWRTPEAAAGWQETEPAGGVDGAFAAVIVSAPPPAANAAHPPRWTLLLDRSAASRGDADALAHPLVRALFAACKASDRVGVIGSDQIAAAAPADVARALEAAWPTTPGALDLSRTLAAVKPHGAPIILVTSGLVADDAAVIAAARRLQVPVHVIGVGPAPARGLLAQIAIATGGTLRFAVPGDDVAQLAAQVLADAQAPVIPLAVNWGTLGATAVVPGTLPRLGAGQSTLVLARISHPGAANARVRGDLFAFARLTTSPPPAGATVALGPLGRRWARARLEELIAEGATAAAITAHALKYGLVSPYTSMVAIGTAVVVEGGVKHSVSVPVAVPAGMKWQAVQRENTVEIEDDDTVSSVGKGGPSRSPTTKAQPPVTAIDRSPRASSVTGADADEAMGTSAAGEAQPRSDSSARLEVADDTLVMTAYMRRRGSRFALGLGAGALVRGGAWAGLIALDVRADHALGRVWLGIDAALWARLAGASGLEGRVLGALAVGVGRQGELAVGVGVQVTGAGLGPAWSIALRHAIPLHPAFASFARYDGAVLFEDGAHTEEHAVTLGIEWSF